MNHHDVRRFATGLAGAVEQPHHGFPSFRVAKKIFATLPDEDHVHIMLSPDAIREAVALDPAACAEKWWGTTLSAVRVSLDQVPEDVLEALLTEAWAMRRSA